MKKYFPSQQVGYLETNRGNLTGSIWSSFNLDFQTNPEATRISQKLVINTSSSDDADLGRAAAFETYDNGIFAICDTRVFYGASGYALTGGFTEDASAGAQTDYDSDVSDLARFNGRMWSTTVDALYSKATSGTGTGAWTSRDTLSSSSVHKMCYLKKFNRLYYVYDDTSIGSIDDADVAIHAAGDYFIDLDTNNGEITTIIESNDNIWVGTTMTTNSSGSEDGAYGTIFQWDGISAQPTNQYKLTAAGCLAMVNVNNIPYAIDTEARILRYTGSSFEEVNRLPVDRILLKAATIRAGGTSSGRFVHYNGMVATKNNTILIYVNNLNYDNDSTVNENLASGIWEFDLNTNNFTHRYSNTLKTLASSTVTDYGQNRLAGVGALKLNTLATNVSGGRSSLICGATYYTSATVTAGAIFIDSPAQPATDTEGQKKAYFVTTWFTSDEVADAWDEIWATYRQFQASTDSVVFKYRIKEESPTYATITWTSTTTFTTTTDITAYGPTATGFDSTTGGEVEVLQGTGSGSCSHITSVVDNAGTYTVTLDEAVTGVSSTAKARFQKWIKIFPSHDQSTASTWSQYTIGTDSTPRIQIKGCLTWTGDGEFYKFILNSNEDITS